MQKQQQDAAVNAGMKMELIASPKEQLLNNSMHWSQGAQQSQPQTSKSNQNIRLQLQ